MSTQLRIAGKWGRIRRRFLWPFVGEEEFTELRIVPAHKRAKFARAVSAGEILSTGPNSGDDRRILSSLTAQEYLHIARICYAAAFNVDRQRPPVDLYRAFADGRDGGLISLSPRSEKAFETWFRRDAYAGAHPFEIFRDEILLIVHAAPGGQPGYWLRLTSYRRDRVSPYLILMALGLSKEKVPFVMENAADHGLFAAGEDWIGVAEDRVWKRGVPVWPDGSGILNTLQNSITTSELARDPAILRRVRWFCESVTVQPYE